ARTDIFSPGAVDYIYRCSEGIPRNINNLCDNALLHGFAASEHVISRALVEEVAGTFDMVPRSDRGVQNGYEREAPARIFNASGRAELWSAGTGNGNGDSHFGSDNSGSDETFTAISTPETDIVYHEYTRRNDTPATIEELGSAFSRSGLGRGNNGQSL